VADDIERRLASAGQAARELEFQTPSEALAKVLR
jgi:hypothetical protein